MVVDLKQLISDIVIDTDKKIQTIIEEKEVGNVFSEFDDDVLGHQSGVVSAI